jgi:hypothetical protein
MPRQAPPYAPVKPSPTIDDCIRSLRLSDYCQWAGSTIASWGYGFIVGKPARFAIAGMMAGIGFTFGSMVVLQNTRGRLMGYRENSREVKRFGAADPDHVFTAEDLFQPNMDWKKQN